MRGSRYPSSRKIITVTVIAALIALPCLLIYREIRHQRLNRELIAAISHNRDDRAIELVREGADGTAKENDREPLTVGTVLHRFLDRFLHRNQQAPNSKISRRPALLLYYETARDNENHKTSPGPAPPVSEKLPHLLLDHGAMWNEADSKGFSVLYWAAHFHNHSVLHRLANLGANVNMPAGALGYTPLMQADSIDTRVLLDHGASPNAAGKDGTTALFTADAPKAEMLIAVGAKVDAVDKGHDTPLIVSCKDKRSDVALLLLRHGASASAQGSLALWWAAAYHNHNVLRELVNLGANVNMPGYTPLMQADIIDARVLLDHGANPNAADGEGATALFTADVPKAEMLLAAGAKLEAADKHHTTPLMRACTEGRDRLALYLLKRGANIGVRDSIGSTALLRAAERCKLETILALIKAGANPREVDKKGNTALMAAVENDDTRVLPWMLKQGIDINARGISGHTALSIADECDRGIVVTGKPISYYRGMITRLKALGATKGSPTDYWYGEDGD